MYASIRRYRTDSGSADEIIRQANEGFVPIIRQAPGFRAYYIVDAGGGVVTTISIFEDQEGAEESTRMAAAFVNENLAPLLPNPPEVTAGEVASVALAAS